jgi:hypothetical protein
VRELEREAKRADDREKARMLEDGGRPSPAAAAGVSPAVMSKLELLQDHKFTNDEQTRIADAMKILDPKRGAGLAAITYLLVNTRISYFFKENLASGKMKSSQKDDKNCVIF